MRWPLVGRSWPAGTGLTGAEAGCSRRERAGRAGHRRRARADTPVRGSTVHRGLRRPLAKRPPRLLLASMRQSGERLPPPAANVPMSDSAPAKGGASGASTANSSNPRFRARTGRPPRRSGELGTAAKAGLVPPPLSPIRCGRLIWSGPRCSETSSRSQCGEAFSASAARRYASSNACPRSASML
jgi:hypothetical protein